MFKFGRVSRPRVFLKVSK